jgi:hypothetical protein
MDFMKTVTVYTDSAGNLFATPEQAILSDFVIQLSQMFPNRFDAASVTRALADPSFPLPQLLSAINSLNAQFAQVQNP